MTIVDGLMITALTLMGAGFLGILVISLYVGRKIYVELN
jgi:hypothetical protein